MNKDYAIYSLDLTNYLIKMGYRINRVKPNTKASGKLVFYFINEPSLHNVVIAYKKVPQTVANH